MILTHALQSAGGLLDGFWLGGLPGVRGIATAASFLPASVLLLALIIGLGAVLLSITAIVGVEWPVAVALEARFGLAGVFWACPAAFLAVLVLHGLYYLYKEKKDGLFCQPSVAISAADGRAPGA
ncbi:MAG: hypothetical protein EOO28_06460 [Comamonadaceae bacterium]|nr:MAG: hypothetical protein EOO28_06460 [Comamonadaceae bacterium]